MISDQALEGSYNIIKTDRSKCWPNLHKPKIPPVIVIRVLSLPSFQLSTCGDKPVDPAKEEVSPDDLITLAPYLLQLTIVPEETDEAAIGSANDNKTYIAWKQG